MYPYVGHYDPTKKYRKRWCSLNENQLNSTELLDNWYQNDYHNLMKKVRIRARKDEYTQESKEMFVRAGKLLEKHGFPKYRIGSKLLYDLNHWTVLEKPIEDALGYFNVSNKQ